VSNGVRAEGRFDGRTGKGVGSGRGANLAHPGIAAAARSRDCTRPGRVQGADLREKFPDRLRPGVTCWTLHHLRRSFASNLAKLGVRIEVIERLLNHDGGAFRGVAGVYQRYMPEMREDVEKWESRLTEIISI
jgi:integrase